ncbi:hypothetical protein MLD38_014106 [Melastoma candidum]|uniref:Uncharacterized protein n=1 Tax=Melastoma candidum TaxID=119954 RepID=A0ACB9RBT0_9MYRT|nr:hypothetical protein MLD38_014106 [Melastoma candidum]
MSNNLASQTLHLPSATPTMSQYEHTSSSVNASRPSLQMPLTNPISDLSSSQTSGFFVQPMNPSYTMSKGTESLGIPVQSLSGPPFFASPVNPVRGMAASANNLAVQQQFASLSKRKAPMDSKSGGISPHLSVAPKKRPTHADHQPWLAQQAALNRMNLPGQAVYQMPIRKSMMMQNKNQSLMESIPAKSVQQQRLSSHKTQNSPKVKQESFESVRSKMRESLVAALALVTLEDSRSPEDVKNPENDTATKADMQKATLSTVSLPSPRDDGKDTLGESGQKFGSSEGTVGHDSTNAEIGSHQSENANGSVSLMDNMPTFQYGGDILGEDVLFSDNFFVKDDLLQGNGLSWALEAGGEMVDRSHASEGEKSGMVSLGARGRESPVQSPEILASKIEAELFKLFGGVNKKYKEKGRSLLFNLKDRSNPELRERVLSGEIPPDKLCSMSAEELASKELSQWRMAKAEELAQMVVLPDTEVDLKRLVKKTHKGELQVEVEQDDSISVEVSAGVGITSYRRSRTKEQQPASAKEGEGQDSLQVGDEKKNALERDAPFTLTIPSEDQVSEVDIIEDDTMKDLPPIVSLDEFMQSLDSDSLFEDLQVNAGSTNSSSEKMARVGSGLKDAADNTKVKSNAFDEARSKQDLSDSHVDNAGISEDMVTAAATKGERVWEGSLQLSTSSVVSVAAFFKSGEKTITKDWNSSPEVKGRVRFDAFEKFLQDLRLSRSRALMVVHLVSTGSSHKRERDSIVELTDSYVADERVGIVEPCAGSELYLCPPNDKICQMLAKALTGDQVKTLDEVDEGLIGVLVWRRVQPRRHSSMSSRKHSQHQRQQQQQHVSSSKRRVTDRDVNVVSANSPYNGPLQHAAVRPNVVQAQPMEADDDDVPPGFGPGMAAAQDVDDLPEFNFSDNAGFSGTPTRMMGLHHGQSKTSRPVDEIRQLIQKYGHSEVSQPSAVTVGVPIQPWNDDDDIPEWQPASRKTVGVTQQQNLLVTYQTASAATATLRAHAARQPAWQDPRWNRGGV